VVAGTVGTATMTAAYAIEHHRRANARGELDYDDGLVPGQIVAKLMRRGQVAPQQAHELVSISSGA
jgi:hypothetical protein